MEYLSVAQTSTKWGISTGRIQSLCDEDRIDGAMRIGAVWEIPKNAEKPKDAQISSGQHFKRGE